MARYCKNCGNLLDKGVAFCSNCNAEVDEVDENGKVHAGGSKKAVVAPVAASDVSASSNAGGNGKANVYANGAACVTGQAKVVNDGTVSTGTFFGLILLFSIPVIGWIACIILAFAPKKQSLKNYARAMLIWILIEILILVMTYFLVNLALDAILDYINDVTGQYFSDFGDMFASLEELINEGKSMTEASQEMTDVAQSITEGLESIPMG